MKKYYNYQIKKAVSVNELKTVERLKLDKGFSYPSETHKFYEFVYIMSGNIYCETANTGVKLNTGDFKLIPPQTEHKYFSHETAEIFIVCFKCKSGITDIVAEDTVHLNDDEYGLLRKIISESEKSFEFPFKEKIVAKKDAPFGAQQLTENLIEELLIMLIRGRIENTEITFVEGKNELTTNIVNDVAEILSANLYGKIGLDDICKKTFYSKTYLNNVFKKSKGITIKQYYIDLKIKESIKLIKKGIPTKEIADTLCFESPNYFEKVFKKKTGVSPKTYKKQARKG